MTTRTHNSAVYDASLKEAPTSAYAISKDSREMERFAKASQADRYVR